MTHHHLARAVVSTVLLAALAGCSGDDPSGTEPSSDPGSQDQTAGTETEAPVVRDDAVAEPAWTVELDVLGQPQVEDGVAVVLTRTPARGIEVVAVDAQTGERLWSRPWSPGDIPTGYGLEPLVARSAADRPVVVFSVPPRDLSAAADDAWIRPVAVVDLRSGEELARTAPLDLLTPLSRCADDVDVCFVERDGAGGQRLDLERGQVAADPAGTPAGARTIGADGLFATSDRPGEEIGVARDGKVLWSTPVEELMGETVSSDTGWTIEHDPEADRYVGWMRAAIPPDQRERAEAGKAFSYDAGILRLVAFSGPDGTVLWRRDGAEQSCLGLDTDTPTVRCVWTGTAAYDAEGTLTALRDGSGTVEGFDPRTGETTWSLEIAEDAVEDAFDDRDQKVAGDRTVLVDTDDGPLVVDVATGATAPADADDVFTCSSDTVIFDYAVPYVINGEPVSRRYAGHLFRPCGADGTDRDAYTVAAVRDSAQDAGEGVHVLAGEGTLSGFDLGE